eukprot:15485335-Alexandrium_andersonii.AAC.1
MPTRRKWAIGSDGYWQVGTWHWGIGHGQSTQTLTLSSVTAWFSLKEPHNEFLNRHMNVVWRGLRWAILDTICGSH